MDDPAVNKKNNSNDNHARSWFKAASPENVEKYAAHIPLAERLIARYGNRNWKDSPGSWEYQKAQFEVCTALSYTNCHKEERLRFLAVFLECPAIILLNAKSPEIMEIPDFA